MDFDSDEELYFSWYLEELIENGFIKGFVLHPKTYQLSDPIFYEWEELLKTKSKPRVSKLLEDHVYTPDFLINWNEKARGIFYEEIDSLEGLPKNLPYFIADDGKSIIEIKPSFDQNNMTRLVMINIKWVYEKFGDYVQKVIPIPSVSKAGKISPGTALFAKTFTPKRYLLTDKSMKPRKIRFPVLSIDEFVKSRING